MKIPRVTASILAVFLLISSFISCKSYPPAFNVETFYSDNSNTVEFITSDSYMILMPKKNEKDTSTETGIIFYPGGLVDYHSYLPLFTLCAEEGIVCYIVRMPFGFAFMDKKIAGKIQKQHPEIKNWYLAGHSLGGAIAASYISQHTKDFNGLVLLASYSTHDISNSGLKVLSIYGSNDGILDLEHYQENHKNLPSAEKGLTEIIIDGANHAQFASYGTQKGDYTAAISASEQQEKTASEICRWILEKTKEPVNE